MQLRKSGRLIGNSSELEKGAGKGPDLKKVCAAM